MRDVGLMGAIVLVGAVFLVVALLVALAVLAVRTSWTNARVTAMVAGSVVIVYAAALVIVSLATPARSLAIGEWMCFDDWCASVTSVTRTGDAVLVTCRYRTGDAASRHRTLHGCGWSTTADGTR